MSHTEIIEQLENTIGLIKQDGKDWLDDRDIPILEVCIKSLTALDKIRAEIEQHRRKTQDIDPYDLVGDCLDIIDKYKAESEVHNADCD